jgi:hypothetical protein
MKDVVENIDELIKTKEFKGLSDNSFKLINDINYILALIISDTIKYNKFTTVKEIMNSQNIVYRDANTIEYICEALCLNEGVLMKFINGNKISYKLNNKLYM